MFKWYKKKSIATKILIFMIIGILAGIVFQERAMIVAPVGDLFIRLLIMVAIPLVFFNLLAGLTSMTDTRNLGRIGIKILTYYITTTALAVTLGVAMTHLFKPGIGLTLSGDAPDDIGTVPSVVDIILDLVPENIFEAFSSGNVAQIVVFASILGIVTLFLPKEQKEPLAKAYNLLADLLRKLVGVIMAVAPIGIGALAASTVGEYGSLIFGPMTMFIVTVFSAQLTMMIFYMILLITIARMSPLYFLKKTGPLYATTAGTASSLASLTHTLDIAENNLKLPKSIYSFTLPLGAQINKDGTSIMLGAILIFTAQAAGIELDLATQFTVVLIGLILSEGSGGIPGGGLVIAMIFINAFGLPLEVGAMVAGIYRIIDTGNTTTNCMGDLAGTILVTKTEERAKEKNRNKNNPPTVSS